MKAFEIGFVPIGWECGEEILLTNPVEGRDGSRRRGMVRQAEIPSYSGSAKGDHIFCVEFEPHQAAAVNAWLRWWRSLQDCGVQSDAAPARVG